MNPDSVDRLCGLMVRIPGYRSKGSGFDSRQYQIFWEVVGLVQGPLSLVNTIELLERNSRTPVLKAETTAVGIRCVDHATPSIHKS
jgi:hypothetical protein